MIFGAAIKMIGKALPKDHVEGGHGIEPVMRVDAFTRTEIGWDGWRPTIPIETFDRSKRIIFATCRGSGDSLDYCAPI